MSDEILKFAKIAKQVISDEEMALINKQTLRNLTADEVFVFKFASCNNQVDRDYEHFTDKTLEQLAGLFVGKTMLTDHKWLSERQTARIYAAGVEPMPETSGGKQLVMRAYMLKNESTQQTIDAIEGGIMREVSIGCRTAKAVCDICGVDKRQAYCKHYNGQSYDGKTCTVALDEATDGYEVSFVAVPAQVAAGVTKNYGGEKSAPPPEENPAADAEKSIMSAKLKNMDSFLFVQKNKMKMEEKFDEQENA